MSLSYTLPLKSYFIQALCEGDNIDNLLRTDHSDNVCLVRPLFLHVSLWLLYSDQRYFTFSNKELAKDSLERYCSERIAGFELVLPKIAESYPAIDVETACKNNDQHCLRFFKEIFLKSEGIKTLVVQSTATMDWVLKTLRPLMTSVKSFVIDKACSVIYLENFELVLRTKTLNDGSLETIFSYWKQFERDFSVHLYTERDNVDLSLLLTHFQQGHLKKLQIGAHHHGSDLEMGQMLWYCSNLTHLFVNNQQIPESTIIAISRAVQRENLPFLSHLGLVRCRGLNQKLKLLFESQWSS